MHGPTTLGSGAVMQAGLATPNLQPVRAKGLLVRGVVVATYVTDDPQNPYFGPTTNPCAVYCDVLCYGSQAGPNVTVLPNCLVSQERAGIQSGDVWRPRAATMDISGAPLSLSHSSPQNLDGDHVLVGFMDDLATAPVILRSLPHPRADLGQATAEPIDGQRMRLKLVDGSPDLRKFKGTVTGVDDSANVRVKTLYANKGELTSKGSPPAPPTDSSVGNYIVELHSRAERLFQLIDMDNPQKPEVILEEIVSAVAWQLKFMADTAFLSVADVSGNCFNAKGSGSDAHFTIGDGSAAPAIAGKLEALYNSMLATFNSHTHTVPITPVGTVSTSASPSSAAPAWDSTIASTKVTIPGG